MESMCVNTMHIDADMVCPFCTYPNRRIFCVAGCIYGRFLDMDFEEKERECDVCNSMVCALCIVNTNVLEVVGNILYYDKYVIFLEGEEETVDQDKKMRLLLVPMIFTILLYVPVMILYIISDVYIQEMPEALWNLCVSMLCISMLIWCVLFLYIPIGGYIAMLIVYTVVSWRWILRQKRGNAMYFIVWLVLCVVSILMYWRWGSEFSIMIRQ